MSLEPLAHPISGLHGDRKEVEVLVAKAISSWALLSWQSA